MHAIPTLLQLLDTDWADEARLTPSDLQSLRLDPLRMERDGVLVAARPNDWVNASCDYCSTHDVVPIENSVPPAFWEVCPAGEGGPICADALRTWTLDPSGIAGLLADAVEPRQSAETILPGKAWRIGTVHVGDEFFAVVFATARGAESLAERKEASRMIVAGNRVTQEVFAGTLPIGEVFDFSDDGVTLKPDRLRQAIPFTGRAVGNAFHRRGQVWLVRFGGKETFLENNVGALYIARLIASPQRSVPAVTLLASRIGIDERRLSGSSGELADEQMVEKCRQRYEDLMSELAEAESRNDLARLERLQAEQDSLTTHLASVLGKGGRRREVNDAEKVRKSVSNAIRRTLDVLDQELPEAGEHLRSSLSLGACAIYDPAEPTHWTV